MGCRCRSGGTLRQSWVVLDGDQEHEFTSVLAATRFARDQNLGAPIHRITQETTS